MSAREPTKIFVFGTQMVLDIRMAFRYTQRAMKRTTVWLAEAQIKKLTETSKRTGLKVAELIRRFIDEGLRKQK